MRVYVCKLGHYLAAFICLILNLVTSLTCMHVCEWIRPSLHATICQWPDHNHTVIVQTAMVPQLCRSHTTISLQLHSNHMKIMKPLHCNYTEIIQQWYSKCTTIITPITTAAQISTNLCYIVSKSVGQMSPTCPGSKLQGITAAICRYYIKLSVPHKSDQLPVGADSRVQNWRERCIFAVAVECVSISLT